jgi:hypothetical protein
VLDYFGDDNGMRRHPADRGQGDKEAEAPESIKLTQELPQ